MTDLIELVGITKRFPGVVANDRVDLTVAEGRIHAVCGENGAGKSTLMKILYGLLAPDEGTMSIRGEQVAPRSPAEAIALGIGMVHQHFMLADHLTVLENTIIGAEPMRSLNRIDFAAARRHLEEVGRAYGLEVDPDSAVEGLDVGQRQRVEIIKVLYRGASVLIFDEPTAVLVPHEVDELFRNLRELRDDGCTILFIDHKLDEVLEIADAITVLRQGRVVDTVTPDEVAAEDLVEMMIGAELPALRALRTPAPAATEDGVRDAEGLAGCPDPERGRGRRGRPRDEEVVIGGEVVLDVEGLRVDAEDGVRAVVDGVSLRVRRGEIAGIAGVEGNGQTELIDAILGTRRVSAGRVSLLGEDVTHASVRRRREAGLGHIPQDRHRDGLLLTAPLQDNTTLGHQTEPPCSKWGWLSLPGMGRRARRVCRDFDVRTPGVDVAAHALSGGNQQKLLVGREMSAEPALLVAAHPTRGVDAAAQTAVWRDILDAKARGLATLLVSSDLEELIGLSDAVSVMLRGRLSAPLDPARLTSRELGAHMTSADGSLPSGRGAPPSARTAAPAATPPDGSPTSGRGAPPNTAG